MDSKEEYLKAWDETFKDDMPIPKLKENMFNYQTTKPDRKWFLTKHGELLDLNLIHYLKIDQESDPESEAFEKFYVNANSFDLIGIFDTDQEAKDYIKEIYNFLVAN